MRMGYTGFIGAVGIASVLVAGMLCGLFSAVRTETTSTAEATSALLPVASAPSLSTPAPVELRQPTPEDVWKRIEGCWYETEIKDSGRWGYGGGEQYGWRFGPNGAENWTLTGELQTSSYGEIRIDTTVTPWRFDIIDKHSRSRDKKHAVWAGMIEFQGQDLVWVSYSDWSSMTPGDPFPAAPVDFTSSKENQQIRRVLKRCEYLQTRFP